MASTLALIQSAFGGSWNSRCGQRHVGRLVACLQRAEQRVDGVRLHRADDDGRHLAALHQRDRDLGVLRAGRAHVGVEDAQRVFVAAHEHRPLDHRDRAQRRLLAQVQLLDRPAAGVGQRLDDRRRPHADRVEQRDHRGRGLEVGARRREVLADRLRRRAGDDQVADVAIDDLAAIVDLGRDAFHDRGGREVLAAADDLGVLEVGRLGLRVARALRSPKSDVSMAAPGAGRDRAGLVHREQSRRQRTVRFVTATRGTGRPMAGQASPATSRRRRSDTLPSLLIVARDRFGCAPLRACARAQEAARRRADRTADHGGEGARARIAELGGDRAPSARRAPPAAPRAPAAPAGATGTNEVPSSLRNRRARVRALAPVSAAQAASVAWRDGASITASHSARRRLSCGRSTPRRTGAARRSSSSEERGDPALARAACRATAPRARASGVASSCSTRARSSRLETSSTRHWRQPADSAAERAGPQRERGWCR